MLSACDCAFFSKVAGWSFDLTAHYGMLLNVVASSRQLGTGLGLVYSLHWEKAWEHHVTSMCLSLSIVTVLILLGT